MNKPLKIRSFTTDWTHVSFDVDERGDKQSQFGHGRRVRRTKCKRLVEGAKVSIGNVRLFFDHHFTIGIRQFLDLIDRRCRESIARACNYVHHPVHDGNGTMASLCMLSAEKRSSSIERTMFTLEYLPLIFGHCRSGGDRCDASGWCAQEWR